MIRFEEKISNYIDTTKHSCINTNVIVDYIVNNTRVNDYIDIHIEVNTHNNVYIIINGIKIIVHAKRMIFVCAKLAYRNKFNFCSRLKSFFYTIKDRHIVSICNITDIFMSIGHVRYTYNAYINQKKIEDFFCKEIANKNLVFGLEIETIAETKHPQCLYIIDDIIDDRSLSEDGIEIRTYPFSENDMSQVYSTFKYLKRLKCKCDDTCGGHIHVDRESINTKYNIKEDEFTNILSFFVKRKKFFECVSDRTESPYARFYNNNKYTAINTNHNNTIEFRNFAGHNNFKDILFRTRFIDLLLSYYRYMIDNNINDFRVYNFTQYIFKKNLKMYWILKSKCKSNLKKYNYDCSYIEQWFRY